MWSRKYTDNDDFIQRYATDIINENIRLLDIRQYMGGDNSYALGHFV